LASVCDHKPTIKTTGTTGTTAKNERLDASVLDWKFTRPKSCRAAEASVDGRM